MDKAPIRIHKYSLDDIDENFNADDYENTHNDRENTDSISRNICSFYFWYAILWFFRHLEYPFENFDRNINFEENDFSNELLDSNIENNYEQLTEDKKNILSYSNFPTNIDKNIPKNSNLRIYFDLIFKLIKSILI